MTGAINLKPDFFTGRTLLNLDSEDEGIFFISDAPEEWTPLVQ